MKKEAKTKKEININGVNVPLLINNRAYVEFERKSGHSSTVINGIEDAIMMLYCGLKSGAKNASLTFDMDFEQFIDYTDAHPEIMEEELGEG